MNIFEDTDDHSENSSIHISTDFPSFLDVMRHLSQQKALPSVVLTDFDGTMRSQLLGLIHPILNIASLPPIEALDKLRRQGVPVAVVSNQTTRLHPMASMTRLFGGETFPHAFSKRGIPVFAGGVFAAISECMHRGYKTSVRSKHEVAEWVMELLPSGQKLKSHLVGIGNSDEDTRFYQELALCLRELTEGFPQMLDIYQVDTLYVQASVMERIRYHFPLLKQRTSE